MGALREIADGLWAARQDHRMMGLHLGTRMSVLRLPDGSILLYSPIDLTEELREEVDALGRVSHVVMPNAFHHLYAGPWIEAYPEATTHGPASLRDKRPDLRIDQTLSATPHPDWEGSLIPHPIDGCLLEETVFVHPATRTVVSVDLTENFPSCDHFFTRQYLRVNGALGKVGWPRVLRPVYRDRRAARRSIDALLEHDFERVVIAHGDIIETGGPDAVRRTFEGWLR